MNIAVYCGANVGEISGLKDETLKIAQWIAKSGHSLIFGGGKAGLMGLLADEVLKSGGQAIGIIPDFLKKRELAHEGLSQLLVVDSMSDRKRKMIELADVCIALPGGPGTLEEITEAFSWARIGQNESPCIFYNFKDFWQPVRKMYDDMVAKGFLSSEDREQLLFSDQLSEIEAFIANYTAPVVRKY